MFVVSSSVGGGVAKVILFVGDSVDELPTAAVGVGAEEVSVARGMLGDSVGGLVAFISTGVLLSLLLPEGAFIVK